MGWVGKERGRRGEGEEVDQPLVPALHQPRSEAEQAGTDCVEEHHKIRTVE